MKNSGTRFLSLLLALCLTAGLCTVLATPAGAASYDAGAAVAYADEHWDDGKGLCDQFVKACLRAGGINISSGSVMGVYRELLNYGSSYRLTMRKDGYCYAEDNPGIVAPGDVVFFECSQHKTANLKVHTGIVTNIAANGRVQYSQHNGAYHNLDLGKFKDASGHKGSSISYHVVHLEGGAVSRAVSVAFSEGNMTVSAGAASAYISIPVSIARTAAGAPPTSLGYEVFTADGGRVGEYVWNYSDGSGSGYTAADWVISHSTSDAGIPLSPDTQYQYRGYAVVDGQRYESSLRSFATQSAGIDVRFRDALDAEADCVFARDVTETNAMLYTHILYYCDPPFAPPADTTRECGAILYDAGMQELGRDSDVTVHVVSDYAADGGLSRGSWGYDGDINADFGIVLEPGTPYYCRMFFRLGDDYLIYSEPQSFRTQGTAPSFLLNYDANGGSEVPASVSAGRGETVAVTAAVPTRSGFAFAGWSADSGAEYPDLAPGTLLVLDKDVTLYAVWEAEADTAAQAGVEDEPEDGPAPAAEAAEVHFPRQTVYYPGQFTDVPEDQWFSSSVAVAFELGLMKGNSADTFNPNGDVTAAEAVTMAARIHSIYTTGEEHFVQSGKWYQVYLDYAYENGIISRAYYNSDVTHKATRAQFAEILAAALPEEGLPPVNRVADDAIPDVPMTERFAGAVYKLYRAGILTGSDAAGTFRPQTGVTRAEAAAIVSRMAESGSRKSVTLG